MRLAYLTCATVVGLALFATPACTRVVPGSPVLDAGAAAAGVGECASVSAPVTSIESRAAGEPQMKIPEPPGWQRSSMLDSEIIRFTMGNKALTDRNFTPTAVVTLEPVADGQGDPQTIFDQERAALVEHLGATGLQTTKTTLCGDNAELVNYDAPSMGRVPPRKAKTLMVTGTFGGNSYVATVTVQSTDSADPTYARDSDTILTGFQFLPPDGG